MGVKKKILAVDDNSISLATIEQELDGEFEVIPLNSGIRALQFLQKEKPDLILLDIQMALKDGIETLKEKAYALVGTPDDLEWEEQVVAVLEARDGTILDVVRKIRPFTLG